jgi:hypothetical protein
MKICLGTALIIVLFGNSLLGQTNSIELSFAPRLWLNSLNVHHDDFLNDAMSASNKLNYAVDLSYKKSLSSNTALSFTSGLGRYAEKVTMNYSEVDKYYLMEDRADESIILGTSTYGSSSEYINLGIGFTYSKPISKSTAFAIKIGIAKLFFLNAEKSTTTQLNGWPLDAHEIDDKFTFAEFTWNQVANGRKWSGPWLVELGVDYRFSIREWRTFIVGLNASLCPLSSLNGKRGEYATLKDYRTDLQGNRHTVPDGQRYGEQFIPKYASIGLKFGVELFKF